MLKIQNSPNVNSFNKTNFKGKTPHTAANFNPEKKNDIKEYKRQLQGLMIAGAAMLAALNITGCTVQNKEFDKAQNHTTIEETTDNDFNYIQPTGTNPGPSIIAEISQSGYPSPGNIIDIDDFSQTEKQDKFKTSKSYIEDAIKECDNLHNEVWNNLQTIYDVTKDIDGKTFDGPQNGDKPLMEYQDENKNLKGFYENYLITQIALGEITPGEGIETEKDAAFFIEKLIEQASSGRIYHPFVSDKPSVTSQGNINKGELDIINKALDELEQINGETKAAADIYRKELETAGLKSKEWMAENSMEAELSGLDGDEIKDYYILNADYIKEQAAEIKKAKTTYKNLKASFVQNQNNMTKEEREEAIHELQGAFQKYRATVNIQIANGNLNPNLVNGSIEILEKYAKEAIKKAHEQIFKPVEIISEPQEKATSNKTGGGQTSTGIPVIEEDYSVYKDIGVINEGADYSTDDSLYEEE